MYGDRSITRTLTGPNVNAFSFRKKGGPCCDCFARSTCACRRERISLLRLVCAAFLLIAPIKLSAQFTATVEGQVVDPSSAAVANAEIVIENRDTGLKRTVVTTETGYYRLASLGAGNYTLRVSSKGFETSVAENVNLENDQTKTFNIQLKLGAASSIINVNSEVPLVETGEARISSHIDSQEVQNLPLVGRNFMTLVVLTPGVTGLPSGGGQAYAQATGTFLLPSMG